MTTTLKRETAHLSSQSNNNPAVLPQAVVSCESLTKSYGKVAALRGVDLSIGQGEIVALLGSNGAGKTTLIDLMLGRLGPDSGNMQINGHLPGSLAARQSIGAILQSTKLPDTLTVLEHIRLFSSYYPNPMSLESVLALANLESLAQRRFSALSGGQKQRVFFALAICGRPQIVFLDEPTVGLDTQSRKALWHCIKSLAEQGTSILLTTHYLEEADALADSVLVMKAGKIIAQGSPDDIKASLGGKVIRFKSELALEHFKAIACVTKVQLNEGYIELKSDDVQKSLKALMQKDDVHDLTVAQSSLEEAFVGLLGSEDL